MSTVKALLNHFGEDKISIFKPDSDKESVKVLAEDIVEVIQFLKSNETCFFDYLTCITGMDNEDSGRMEIIYSLYSIPFDKHLEIRIEIENPGESKLSQEVPSISELYRSANWMEREIYDMYGIPFKNHPDLRRILMPADWVGFPLRKNYKTSEKYHGITIDYKEES